jgi:hypothetical protein
MFKLCTAGILGSGLVWCAAVAASAQALPPSPPPIHYALPPPVAGQPFAPLYEGRSVYQLPDPATFPGGVDEKGYPSGLPQNPQIGG